MESQLEHKTGISGNVLKWFAVLTMLVDHIGASILLQSLYNNPFGWNTARWNWFKEVYYYMRGVGRLAFPIYCFLLVEGFIHTRNERKYALRLLIFAFLSEIPFDLAFDGVPFKWDGQNVFFTLFLGFVAMMVIKEISSVYLQGMGESVQRWLELMIGGATGLIIGGIAQYMHTDYGLKGVACIVLLYLFRRNRMSQICVGIVSFMWERIAPLAFLPIALYNGEKGRQIKYFFYLFYPMHLLLLFMVCYLIGIPYRSQ